MSVDNIIHNKIHNKIEQKLNNFIKKDIIPHIIFHGPLGNGKHTILKNFIHKIYKNHDNKNELIMNVNCAHNKGIKFIRNELKFFAKSNLKKNNIFKSIILVNAEELTIDAQSALRRCIELFSHTTRFFILIKDINKLLKPIISRFSIIYIPLPIFNNKKENLHSYKLKNVIIDNEKNNRRKKLKGFLQKKKNKKKNIVFFIEILYNNGFSGLDLIEYLKTENLIKDDKHKYLLLTFLNTIKREFKNEKIFMLFVYNLIFLRKKLTLENILSI